MVDTVGTTEWGRVSDHVSLPSISFLSSGLRAFPSGLSAWASLDFLATGHPQGGQTAYVATEGLKSECSRRQGRGDIVIWDLALEVMLSLSLHSFS